MNTTSPIDQPAALAARIGERLRKERKRLNLTQTALLEWLCITRNTAISYEAGNTCPDAEKLAKLAEIGFDVTYVITGTSQSTPKGQAPLTPHMVHHLRLSMVQAIGTKNKATAQADRDALTRVIAAIAAELSIPYQP